MYALKSLAWEATTNSAGQQHTIYASRRFITVFKKAHQRSPSQDNIPTVHAILRCWRSDLPSVAAETSVIITTSPVSFAQHIPQLKQTAVKTSKFTLPSNQTTTTISSGKSTRTAVEVEQWNLTWLAQRIAITLSAILFQSDTSWCETRRQQCCHTISSYSRLRGGFCESLDRKQDLKTTELGSLFVLLTCCV